MGVEGAGDDSVEGEGLHKMCLVYKIAAKNKSMLISTVFFLPKSFHKEFIFEYKLLVYYYGHKYEQPEVCKIPVRV